MVIHKDEIAMTEYKLSQNELEGMNIAYALEADALHSSSLQSQDCNLVAARLIRHSDSLWVRIR